MGKVPADRPATAAQFMAIIGIPTNSTAAMRVSGYPTPRRGQTARYPAIAMKLPWYRRPLAIGAAAVAVVAAIAGVIMQSRTGGGRVSTESQRVAVLYFDDRSRDSSLGPLASGLTDGLIQSLAAAPSLSVVTRSGVEPFRGTTLASDSIARALRAGSVVRGEVEPEGNQVRVTVRLDDGSGVNLQRESFVRPPGELLAMRDELTQRVSDLLRRQLGAELEIQSQRAGAANAAAWLLLQRGEQARRLGEERARSGDAPGLAVAFTTADSLFALAERADPSWTEPIVARANVAYRRSRLVGRDPATIRPWVVLGEEHATRALATDARNADALEVRGNLRYWAFLMQLEADPNKAKTLLASARKDLEDATISNPRQAGAFASLSHLYNQVNSPTDVVLAAQRALEADEFLANADVVLGRLFTASYDLAQFDKADQWCGEIQRRYSSGQLAVRCQLFLLTGRGKEPDVARAWTLADSVIALTPPARQPQQRRYVDMLVASVIARAADQRPALADSARRVVERAVGDAVIDPNRELPFLGARVYVQLASPADAVRLLKEHLAANPQRAAVLRDDPGWWFRDLAADAAFRQLVGTSAR